MYAGNRRTKKIKALLLYALLVLLFLVWNELKTKCAVERNGNKFNYEFPSK